MPIRLAKSVLADAALVAAALGESVPICIERAVGKATQRDLPMMVDVARERMRTPRRTGRE